MTLRRAVCLGAVAILLSPAVAAAQEEEAIEEAAIVELPSILREAEAVYPPIALKQRIEAEVVLDVLISETGTVSEAAVVSTATIAETLSATVAEAYGIVRSSTITDYGFGAAAEAAVRSMLFSPAKVEGGIPIPVQVPFTYRFDLPPLPPLPDPSARAPDAPKVLSISGVLRERGTRSLIPGVVVTVFRGEGDALEAYEAVSDATGRFDFYDLAPGKWRIQGEAEGYFPIRDTLPVVVNEVTEVTYFMEKGSYSPYDVFVQSDPVKREVNRRTLTREEIRTVPGTLGDPILVIENLPGVARPAAASGNIIVRGSGTNDTLVYIDGVEVPIIFHFGGLKSVLPFDVVETVDFYPGNFSAYYGRGTGGVFDAHIRRLDPDQVHGAVEASLLDVGLFVETPVGENAAVAVGGRRSVVGDVISGVVPEDANAGVIAAPVYYDGQVLANWRIDDENDLRLFLLASDDTLELLFDNVSDVSTQLAQNDLSTSINFQRATLEYRHTPSETYQNTLLFSLGRNFINFNGFSFLFELETLQILARDTARWRIDDALTFRAGFDLQLSSADVRARLPGAPPVEGQTGGGQDLDDVRETEVADVVNLEMAPFIEAEWNPVGPLFLYPGLRVDYFQVVDQWSVDPRLVARYVLDERLALKGGVGVVYQAPLAQQVLEPFGNPDAGLQRGIQYSLGTEFQLPPGLGLLSHLEWDLTVFYKDLADFITSTDARTDDGDPLNFANTAVGRIYGLEAFIEHPFSDNFRGWVSYTLSRSERRDRPGEDFRLFDFDQTHILNVVASYVLPENIEIGIRFRLVSGNPFTPSRTVQTGQSFFDADLDSFSNVPGEVNSERLPFFSQLDLRVEKGFVFDYWELKAFLSLINTFDRDNPEGFSRNFDFTQQQFATSLPIFPNLGLRGEF